MTTPKPEPVPAYRVIDPLRHDGADYAPGEAAPATLTPEQADLLLAAAVIEAAP